MKRNPRSGTRPAARLTTFSNQTSSRFSLRGGFTLIELLMVIVVISILAAFLLPAVGGAIRRTRETGVKNEISQLESAIANFKNIHGVEPPSNITLYQNPTGTVSWASDPTSTAMIRQIWPQFNFGLTRSNLHNASTGSTSVTLSGSECLVFFLGGLWNGNLTNGFSMIGFSKDPTDPFAAQVTGTTRDAPLFEFQTNRLTDVDSDGVPEYKDAIPGQRSPYLYYSSYDGQGYNSNVNAATGTTSEFYGSGNIYTGQAVQYGLYTCYYQDPAASNPWKPTSYQIISPGYDGTSTTLAQGGGYGFGGPFTPSSTATTPLPLLANAAPFSTFLSNVGVSYLSYTQLRNQEADNITNFSQGRLQP